MKFQWTWVLVLQFFILVFVVDANAQSLCASKPGVVLRRNPTSKASVSWKVPKYMPFMATGKRQGSGWLEVKDVDGQSHWVEGRLMTNSWNCVVVRTKSTRLRMGPGKQFQPSPLGLADRYTAFLDLGGEDGWTQIENDDGEKGWVNMDHLWKPSRRMKMSFDR